MAGPIVETVDQYKHRSVQLRFCGELETKASLDLLELPIVTRGTMEDIEFYVNYHKLGWKTKKSEMYGGYWVDAAGNSFIPV